MKTAAIIVNLLIVSALMLVTAPAYAYLDSGTGSVIIQMLFAGVAGLLAILKLYWEKAKAGWRRFCQLFQRKKVITKQPKPSESTTHHDKTR